jgi:hypothetical protein
VLDLIGGEALTGERNEGVRPVIDRRVRNGSVRSILAGRAGHDGFLGHAVALRVVAGLGLGDGVRGDVDVLPPGGRPFGTAAGALGAVVVTFLLAALHRGL